MVKGIFWYLPHENRLISYKVECDRYGRELNSTEKTCDFGNEYEILKAWIQFPDSVKKFKPYNYYPRGKVDFKKGKAIITINPVLDKLEIIDLIIKEFNIGWVKRIFTVDNSSKYDFLMLYKPKKCNLCGKIFDCWDYEENFNFNKNIDSLYSKYSFNRINLNLCIGCIEDFDKLLDYILSQCKINPISELPKN